MSFLQQFDSAWGPKLALRRRTFRAMFEYLIARRPSGHLIVETGCARNADNWGGDGQSTFLFDRFVTEYNGQALSVDINAAACAYARSIVSPRTEVRTEDSVPFLARLARELPQSRREIDLLYLDSFDWVPDNPVPSAVHHLKELCAIAPALTPGALVVIDDSFRLLMGIPSENKEYMSYDLGIDGKAKFVAQYFQQVGARMVFEGYQCGWVFPG